MNIEVNSLLRDVRKKKQLTIMQLSKLSEVSKSHISEIENGKQVPSILVLCRLAYALGVSPEELYTYKIY